MLINGLVEVTDKSTIETSTYLKLQLGALDSVRWQWLRAMQKEAPKYNVSLRVSDQIAGDGYDLLIDELPPIVGRNVELVCAKEPVADQLRFFLSSSVKDVAENEPAIFEQVNRVLVADIDAIGYARGFVIQPWSETLEPLLVERPKRLSVSPRKILTDLSGVGLVPSSVEPWLPETMNQEIYEYLFRSTSTRRLALCLATALSLDESNQLRATVHGRRRLSFNVESMIDDVWQDEKLTTSVRRAAEWVYCEGPEADNKHALLTSEIARTVVNDSKWGQSLISVLEDAVHSARIAYRLYLQERGADALKLMSDLRKGLADDVRAVSAQASALASGLWRDAAVAFAAIALRTVSKDTGPWVLLCVVVYLTISWYFTCRVATKGVNAIGRNEKVFRSKLYMPLLPSNEYEVLAGSEYNLSIIEFKKFRRLVSGVYFLAIAGLVAILMASYGTPIKAWISSLDADASNIKQTDQAVVSDKVRRLHTYPPGRRFYD